jgi:nitrosocyanin
MKLFHDSVLALSLTIALITGASLSSTTASAETLSVNVVAVEVAGTKFWLPSTIIAKKGDTVKIHAISKVPGQNNVHGFAIDQFKIQAVVTEKPMDLEFVADKAGIFPIRCHLHPAHIGGQLLVME